MHPVLMQDLAAEHIKAMTAAAGITRSVRRARRARRRKDAGRTAKARYRCGPAPCPQPGDELAKAHGFSGNLTETAGSVPGPGRSALVRDRQLAGR